MIRKSIGAALALVRRTRGANLTSRGAWSLLIVGTALLIAGFFGALNATGVADSWGFGLGLALGILSLGVTAFGLVLGNLGWAWFSLHKEGECRRCGYDLRGLTEPRCPECFTKFDPSSIQSPPDQE